MSYLIVAGMAFVAGLWFGFLVGCVWLLEKQEPKR